MRRLAFIVLIAVTAGGIAPAAAERLVVSLSNHRVAVTSSFTGEDLVLFGNRGAGGRQDAASGPTIWW